MPFLTGERVRLRPLEEDDAAMLAGWINCDELRPNLANRFPVSVRGEAAWLQSMAAEVGARRDIVLGVELHDQGDVTLIGTVGLHAIDWIQRRAMTGTMIGLPSHRGRGLGTEAKMLLLDYAFLELGLHAVWTHVRVDNVASVCALEKQGCRRGAVIREAVRTVGGWCDCVYYDLLEDEWRAWRARGAASSSRSNGSQA